MLQSACVSKESHQETMQHNNSFPWEPSGVEPIVCTLLRLWMLPLLQRAYINLAGSKQYCGTSVPSTLRQVTPHTSLCHKRPSCICPWLTLAQSCSTWGGSNAVLAPWLIYHQSHIWNQSSFSPRFLHLLCFQQCCSPGLFQCLTQALMPEAQ